MKLLCVCVHLWVFLPEKKKKEKEKSIYDMNPSLFYKKIMHCDTNHKYPVVHLQDL